VSALPPPAPLPGARRDAPARCAGCGLHAVACLCAELPRLAVRTRVVVLMHRAEARKSTNTGRLVPRLLEGAEIRVRGDEGAPPRAPLPSGSRLLLFPEPGARLLSAADAVGEPVVLLVPDGNWNQARRVGRRDDDARGAEVVALPPGPPSRYGLRRSPREGTVSTLEAVARALGVLEGAAVEAALMDALDAFVARSRLAAGSAGER
jgi:DTW domain-containing protein YfiP